MTRAPMLLNSFRIACRQLKPPGVSNGSCASLGSLAQLPQGTLFPHSSVVEHLLKTPSLYPSPVWSPSSSSSASPLHPSLFFFDASTPTPTPENSPETQWKTEKEDEQERSCLSVSPAAAPLAADTEEVVQPVLIDESPALPDFHAFIDDIVLSVKKEIRAENVKKKRCVKRAAKKCEEEKKTVVIPVNEEKKEEEEGFMICCGRRAKPIDISPRKRKLPLKTESVAPAKKKKVMDAEEMATRIRSQNRAAAKKYRQRMKLKQREMKTETELLEEEQSRLLQHVQQLTVEVEEYKQKLLKIALQSPFPQSDNG